MIRVTVWNEFYHEQYHEEAMKVYPNGIHNTIADFLKCDDITVRTVTLYNENKELNENAGITKELLDDTDVMIWWGHMKHRVVPDEAADLVMKAVQKGMGIIFLHSAHQSKPFCKLLGTSGCLSWREDGDMERIWNVCPSHPITQGIGNYFELAHVETYSEPFAIPTPEDTLFIGWYEGGEVFRSGCTFRRENGKIFYFQPGHETFPIFYDANVQTIIRNAVRWACPVIRLDALTCPHIKKIGTE